MAAPPFGRPPFPRMVWHSRPTRKSWWACPRTGALHLRGQKGRKGKNGDVADQGIAVVVISPFALTVNVGEAFASVVSDADAFSDGREVVVGPMWGVVWGKVFVHDWQSSSRIRRGLRGASGLCASLSVNEAWSLYSVKYNGLQLGQARNR